MKAITIFRFGYDGWGNHTKELVKAADAVEQSRGFAPPCFVDARIRRSVRAKGFVGNAFGELLHERYRWMKGLGNQAVVDGTEGIQIADPRAAATLLDDALEAATRNQRLIYFCSCKWAKVDGQASCHRVAIERLLKAVARRRKIPLVVQEWPGNAPSDLSLQASLPVLRGVARGTRKSVPLPKRSVGLGEVAGLGWASVAHLRDSSGESTDALVGPAQFTSAGWQLPVLVALGERPSDVARERWRKQHGCE